MFYTFSLRVRRILEMLRQVEKLKLIVIFYPDLSIACSALEFFGKEGS